MIVYVVYGISTLALCLLLSAFSSIIALKEIRIMMIVNINMVIKNNHGMFRFRKIGSVCS